MKYFEFYRKYKARYPKTVNKIHKKNWLQSIFIILIFVLVEPFVIYKKYTRNVPFSLDFYLHQIRYILFIGIPLCVALYVWFVWRNSLKQKRGYCWIGKFEVTAKQRSAAACYLILTPDNENKIKVERKLFNKTRVGDFIIIQRDAFGNVEEIFKVRKFLSHLAKRRTYMKNPR